MSMGEEYPQVQWLSGRHGEWYAYLPEYPTLKDLAEEFDALDVEDEHGRTRATPGEGGL